MVADGLRLVGQMVGVDADAVSADQAGPERQEVPLGARGLSAPPRYRCSSWRRSAKFVDQRDVDVALRVLDDLRPASATLMLLALWVPATMMLA